MINVYISLGIDGILIKMVKGKYTKKSYSKKGKWYSYSKINYLLSNTSKLKFSLTLWLGHLNENVGFAFKSEQPAGNKSFPQIDLGELFRLCSAYEAFRMSWGCFKVRGVLFECFPLLTPSGYSDPTSLQPTRIIPWIGAVAMGVFSRGGGTTDQEVLNRRLPYNEIVEGDRSIILNTMERQRFYVKFNMYDYKLVPDVSAGVPWFPGFLQMNSYSTINGSIAEIQYPEWQIRLTFYISAKDKVR